MRSMVDKLDLFRWSAHYEGWPFALFRIAVKSTRLLGTSGTTNRWFSRLAERRFDRRFQVDTGGEYTPEQAGIPTDRVGDAVEFVSASPPHFASFLSKLPVEYRDYAFIDFGSGKGRTLLMASEFPFRKIRGVELSVELHDIARRNLDTFTSRRRQCSDVDSVNCDAIAFEFPNEPLMLYFFNPFSARILKEVLRNLEASLTAHPRHVIAIYHNPIHAGEFHASRVFADDGKRLTTAPDWVLFESVSEQPTVEALQLC